MTSRAATLRNTVINAIDAAKSGLVVTGFTMTLPGGAHTGSMSNFHTPLEDVKEITSAGRVWVVALVGDQDPPVTRNHTCKESIPVQVCYQCKIDNLKDADFLDLRIELCEQLKRVVRKSAPYWCTWLRTEAEKDDNGTPFAYRVMREDSVFMCIFTAYFETFLESEE